MKADVEKRNGSCHALNDLNKQNPNNRIWKLNWMFRYIELRVTLSKFMRVPWWRRSKSNVFIQDIWSCRQLRLLRVGIEKVKWIFRCGICVCVPWTQVCVVAGTVLWIFKCSNELIYRHLMWCASNKVGQVNVLIKNGLNHISFDTATHMESKWNSFIAS